MNPLNRRMFRDPRAARRATGILASSAPLMTSAQKAMAQGKPLRAQTGVSVNTSGYVDPSLAAINRVRVQQGLPAILPNSNNFLVGMARSMQPGRVDPAAATSQVVKDTIQPVFTARDPDPLAEARRMVAGPDYDDLGREEISTVAPGRVAPGFDVLMGGDKDPVLSAPAVEADIESPLSIPRVTPKTPAEAAAESDKPKRSAKQPADADEIFEDAGDSPKEPEKQQVITPDLVQQLDPTAGLSDMERNQRAKPAGESITNKVTNIQSSNLSESKKREKTNEILGIDSLEKEYAVLKEFFGEDRAKDIRTDANYNLMMTGLMIAAGESENAMTNIAKGAAAGLQKYGEAVGEESQDIAAEDKAIKSLVAKTAIERREKQDERTFQQLQADQSFGRRVALTSYTADLRGEAAEKAHERAVELLDKRLTAAKDNVLAQLDSNKELATARLNENIRQFDANLTLAEKKLDLEPDQLRVFRALQDDPALYSKYAQIQLLGKNPQDQIMGEILSDILTDDMARMAFEDDEGNIDVTKIRGIADVLQQTLTMLQPSTTSTSAAGVPTNVLGDLGE